MPLQQYSNGDRVTWSEGDTRRKGIVTASDVTAPRDAGDKAGMRFYQVTAADGSSYTVSEGDLEPTDASTEDGD